MTQLDCSWISAATKCVTGVLVLVSSGFIGYLLYHIIFVFTSDVEEAVVEVVHTLPLVVIPLTAYIIRKLMLLNDADTDKDSQTGAQDSSCSSSFEIENSTISIN